MERRRLEASRERRRALHYDAMAVSYCASQIRVTYSSRIQLFIETPPQLIPFIMLPATDSLLGWLRPVTDIGIAPLPNCGVSPPMLIESLRACGMALPPEPAPAFIAGACGPWLAVDCRAEVRLEVCCLGEVELCRWMLMLIGLDSLAMTALDGD